MNATSRQCLCHSLSLFTLVLAARTQAFLGIGDIVFDPSVYAQAVEQVIRLERQYAQLVESYQMLRNQYEQMLWNARRVPVDMAGRYRALADAWRPRRAANAYGNNRRLDAGGQRGRERRGDSGIRKRHRIAQGLRRRHSPTSRPTNSATSRRATGRSNWPMAPPRDALETIGRLRANASAVQAAIQTPRRRLALARRPR